MPYKSLSIGPVQAATRSAAVRAHSYALAWAVFTAVLVTASTRYTVSIDLDHMPSLSLEYK
jgi:hypothetical protein